MCPGPIENGGINVWIGVIDGANGVELFNRQMLFGP
jgi:hypothetical protein